MTIRQVVILCGGSGSRLEEVTKLLPKPMLPIKGVPYLNFLIYELAQLPIDEILLLTGYKSHVIKQYFHEKIINGVKISIEEEPKPRGTLGALFQHHERLEEQFILCNADTIWNFRIEDLYHAIINTDLKYSHIFTSPYKGDDRYGSIVVTDDNFVKFFNEKQAIVEGSLINSGIYLINKRHINPNPEYLTAKLDIEKNLFQELSYKNQLKVIKNVVSDFYDFGTPESFLQLETIVIQRFRKRIILIDRDNTINEDNGYISAPNPVIFCKNFLDTLVEIKKSNRYCVVVSNQGGIALKKFTKQQSIEFFKEIKEKLARDGLFFLDYLFCPHHPSISFCECRKPGSGLISSWILKEFVDWDKALFIGDSEGDKLFASNVGVNFVQSNTKNSYKKELRNYLYDFY